MASSTCQEPTKASRPFGAPLSLRAARVLANQLLRQRAQGIDITEVKIKGGDSFPSVVKEFISDYARPKNRTWKSTANVLGLIYPSDHGDPILKPDGLAKRWATKSITDIDGAALHNIIAESRRNGGPDPSNSRGRAMASALGKLFAWATQHRKVQTNPALGMFRPASPPARSRVLTDVEIAAVWIAADKVGYPFGHVVKLLLLTGQRRDEIAAMRWSELDGSFSILSLPPTRTKNKRPHVVPMPRMGREIISSVPRVAGCDFVFSTNGKTSISGFSKFKKKLDANIEFSQPWTIHDLRRSAVTHMAELGVQPHVIEVIVNHVSGHKGGIAGVYNKALHLSERKAALELWAEHVASIVGGQR